MSLLSEACELEHALGCSYLYAAFSIKREISEGISWREQQTYRRWQSQLYHVAAQEMLHLGQAWNLLSAVGGTPHYYKPSYPQPARHYPLNVALLLRRFDEDTLERFVYYESPAPADANPGPELARGLWPTDEGFEYASVGELYAECRRLVAALGEDAFIGPQECQVGPDLIDFPDIVAVDGPASAVRAIDRIVEQGEGLPRDRNDSHYAVFRAIRDEIHNEGVAPARPVADNPVVPDRLDDVSVETHPAVRASNVGTTPIADPLSVQAVDLFDDIYLVMLQALHYVFASDNGHPAVRKDLAQTALELMTTVLKPLGEAICLLPSGTDGINAGPTFAITRHVPLALADEVARVALGERLTVLSRHADVLIPVLQDSPDHDNATAMAQARGAAANLRRIAARVGVKA